MGQPFFSFGNIREYAGWSFTFQGGQEPSVFVVTVTPHLKYIQPNGDLIFGAEGEGSLKMKGCRIERPIFRPDRKWDIPILDRRWKWRYGEISGSYNIKRADKSFIREKTPRELAELCLLAMGENPKKARLGDLPTKPRPTVQWDRVTPATALDSLVRSLGCEWTLDPFTDTVAIWEVGRGRNLPDGPTESRSTGYVALAKPDGITVYGARTMYQDRFITRAVAMDTDHTFKQFHELKGYKIDPLDEPVDFKDIEEEYTFRGERLKAKDLASSTAYRAYKIEGLVDGGIGKWSPKQLRGGPLAPQSFWDIELTGARAEQYIMTEEVGPDGKPTGRRIDAQPKIVGRWHDEDEDIPDDNAIKEYKGRVSVDRSGILKFPEPMFLPVPGPSGFIKPAEIYVDAAYYAGRDGVFARPSERIDISKSGAKDRIVIRDDVELRVIQFYDVLKVAQRREEPNDVPSILKEYARITAQEYEEQISLDRTYHGLLPIVPDGRISQVTWSGGDGKGPSTKVSIATRHNPYIPSVDELRRNRRVQQIVNKVDGPGNRIAVAPVGIGVMAGSY